MALTAVEENEIQSDRARRYMRTQVQVTGSGAVLAHTRTWTRQPFIGFTGGVDVFALDANDIILDHTGVHQFGVDGFRIPFKHSDRTVTWFDQLDQDILPQVAKLDIFHFHAPRDRFNDIADEIKSKGGKVLDIVKFFGL
jgi:hypothetical protein